LKKVIVVGGGLAGLSAAYYLAKKGVSVTVLESEDSFGGKCRSFYDKDGIYIGEHGFRVITSEYHALKSLFSELNVVSWGKDFDITYSSKDLYFTRPNARSFVNYFRHVFSLFKLFSLVPYRELKELREKIKSHKDLSLKDRLQLDKITWANFLNIKNKSKNFRKFFSDNTRLLNAIDPVDGSTFVVIQQFISLAKARKLIMDKEPLVQTPQKPNSEVFVFPLVKALQGFNAELLHSNAVVKVIKEGKQIKGLVDQKGNTHTADGYIFAITADQLQLLMPEIPGIKMIARHSKNYSGIQFHCSKKPKIKKGMHLLLETPWDIIIFIQNKKTWLPSAFPQGTHSIVSAIIGEWHKPGLFVNKAAKDCTKKELVDETLYQINQLKEVDIQRSIIRFVHVDPTLIFNESGHGLKRVDSKLYTPQINQYLQRPTITTVYENMFLAGEYLQTQHLIPSMEAAVESARDAAQMLYEKM
jgi:protoporphyrinogen oxidase